MDRPYPPYLGDERTSLTTWLDWHRATLLHKCAGLSDSQLRERAVPPSSLSLLGLVRHMAEVERGWFRVGVAQEQVGWRWITDEEPDAEFDGVDDADVEEAFAALAEEVDRAREVVAGAQLDDTYVRTGRGEISVRWTLVHMIEEYARHNGHADLLRERLDGATGH